MAAPWVIAGVALAGGVVIGHYLWPTPVSGGGHVASGPADTRPPAQRIARDMINACHDLEPFLRQLEAALQGDSTISVSEGAALVQQVRRLT